MQGYDKISIDRIRLLSPTPPAPDGIAFAERHFTILSRLVKKKNLVRIIQAYWIYASNNLNPRKLLLCGYGEEDELLRQEVRLLDLNDLVSFTGHINQEEVSKVLASSLSLLLVSEEEQYGLVAIEALAMGMPVIYSPNCGSGDDLLRSGINGFLVETDNLEGIAHFMTKISDDELLWRELSTHALESAKFGDVSYFSRGVRKLIEKLE